MKMKVTFDESLTLLINATGIVPHPDFNETTIRNYWRQRPNAANEIMFSSWCWLFCWGMSGGAYASSVSIARGLFGKIFKGTDFAHCLTGDSLHEFAKKNRKPGGRDKEKALQAELKLHRES